VYKVDTRKPEPEKKIDANDPSGIGGLIAAFPGGFVPADH